jgi:hypothetical protein
MRTHLKNVFWPTVFFGGMGASFQILDNHQVACGLKLGPVALVTAKPLGEDETLDQNPILEMGSRMGENAWLKTKSETALEIFSHLNGVQSDALDCGDHRQSAWNAAFR